MPPVSERIVLHIGAMKTGTTFLQTTLERNSELLAAADLDFVRRLFALAEAGRPRPVDLGALIDAASAIGSAAGSRDTVAGSA